MKNHILSILFAVIILPITAQPQQQFLSWVNEKRVTRLAPKLEYEAKFQDYLTEVAKSLENRYCHCYSGAYLGEVITKSTSLENCFKSLYASDSHRKIMMMRKARRATVGILESDGWTYLVVRVYEK